MPTDGQDRVAASTSELQALRTALEMIRDNKHGESWSAGVAMSALASVEDECAYITAAGVRCCKKRDHAGAHDTAYVFDDGHLRITSGQAKMLRKHRGL